METIHVARAGATLGAFSLAEVREGLRTGKFLSNDLGWQAGMADWRPLSEIVGPLAASTPVPATPQATAPQPGVASPAATPAALTPAVDYAAAEAQSGLPWERREQLGFFKAFFDTVILVLTKPSDAFRMMKPEGGLMDPLLFALLGASFGLIVSMLVQLVFQGLIGTRDNLIAGVFGMGVGLVAYVFIVPFFILLWMFAWSGLVHLCLMMVGGAKRPYETTLRVVCFSSGATYLISLIPFCGGMIAFVYNLVVQIMGVANAHETDGGKGAMAVLLPLVVCCGGGFVLALLMGGLGALTSLAH